MWAWITAAAGWLVKVLNSRIGGIIVSAMLFLGISMTTYTFGVTQFESLIQNELSGAGFLVDWMGFFAVDKAITIVLSAIAAKYATGAAKVAITKRA